MTRKSKILGVGSSFPPHVWDNDKLYPLIKSRYADAYDRDWYELVFGVFTRHRSLNYETNTLYEGCSDTELAVAAAGSALEMAKVDAKEIDFVLHASMTPDFTVEPDSATDIHEAIGARMDCGVMTFPSTCAGMPSMVNVANALITSGVCKKVLVTAANVYSGYLEQHHAPVFFTGDGAAAIVLGATSKEDESGIIDTCWGVLHDPHGFIHPRSGIAQFCQPTKVKDLEKRYANNVGHSEMNMKNVVDYGPHAVRFVLDWMKKNHGDKIPKLDWVLVHQATILLRKAISDELGVPVEKVPFDIDHTGNTFAASTGILMDELNRQGKLKKGDLMLVLSVGTGWIAAAYLMRW